MQENSPIIVSFSDAKFDILEIKIGDTVAETGIHISDSIRAVRILPAIMPTQLVVQKLGDGEGIAYDGAKVNTEYSDCRICPRP